MLGHGAIGEFAIGEGAVGLVARTGVTATLAAFEVNNDVADFDISAYNPTTSATDLSGARASIVEVGGGRGSISSVEET